MLDQLWLVWSLPLPFVFFYYRFATNRTKFVNKDLSFRVHSPFIIFQVTTKGGSPIVAEVVTRVKEVCNRIGYENYRVDVLTDDPRDFFDATMIYTPRDFQTAHRSRFKSRALHYAVLWRRVRGDNTIDKWVFHLDEESLVKEQTVISILKHICGNNPTVISEGPITYPNRMFEGGYLTRFSEAMRPFICYDCIHQMGGKRIPIHMHGSNLLIRSDIEDRVGWDFGTVASEDQRFGHEAYLMLVEGAKGEGPELPLMPANRVFGWHGGLIEEQPPLSIASWIKQRQRWFIGNIHNIRFGRLPGKIKLEICLRWGIWMAGFPAGLVSLLALFLHQAVPFGWNLALSIVTILWLLSFQIGMRLNLLHAGLPLKRKLWIHLQLLVLTPLVGFIETFAAISAPFKMKNWNWVPTAKQVETPQLVQVRVAAH